MAPILRCMWLVVACVLAAFFIELVASQSALREGDSVPVTVGPVSSPSDVRRPYYSLPVCAVRTNHTPISCMHASTLFFFLLSIHCYSGFLIRACVTLCVRVCVCARGDEMAATNNPRRHT